MTDTTTHLDRARVLILEDDFYLATDLQTALEAAGAVVIGPFADETEACQAIEDERPDCALVDLNLGHGPTFALPRKLMRRSVPFAFVTGYDADTIPREFQQVPQLSKPVDNRRVLDVALRLLAARATPG